MRTIGMIIQLHSDSARININELGNIEGNIEHYKNLMKKKHPTPERVDIAITEFKNPPTHFYNNSFYTVEQSKKFFNTVAQTLTTIRNQVYE